MISTYKLCPNLISSVETKIFNTICIMELKYKTTAKQKVMTKSSFQKYNSILFDMMVFF